MSHPLEERYSLTAAELLDAIDRRFRAKVTLEGAVAEVHLGKQLSSLRSSGIITRFEEHDQDSRPDYTIWIPGYDGGQSIECKNVRDADEAYRKHGVDVAYKVEVQKTRTSNNDPSSRFYDIEYFAILAVCLGKKTGLWTDFMFIRERHLSLHSRYPNKRAAMHRVPLPDSGFAPPWYSDLESLLENDPW